jgi:glucan biosynthesis protein
MDQDPKGFGLVQRDRDYAAFEDDVQRWERRPSLWILGRQYDRMFSLTSDSLGISMSCTAPAPQGRWATDPKGFGLVQRDRDYAAFEDDVQRWERRPSLWIEPLSTWP